MPSIYRYIGQRDMSSMRLLDLHTYIHHDVIYFRAEMTIRCNQNDSLNVDKYLRGDPFGAHNIRGFFRHIPRLHNMTENSHYRTPTGGQPRVLFVTDIREERDGVLVIGGSNFEYLDCLGPNDEGRGTVDEYLLTRYDSEFKRSKEAYCYDSRYPTECQNTGYVMNLGKNMPTPREEEVNIIGTKEGITLIGVIIVGLVIDLMVVPLKWFKEDASFYLLDFMNDPPLTHRRFWNNKLDRSLYL